MSIGSTADPRPKCWNDMIQDMRTAIRGHSGAPEVQPARHQVHQQPGAGTASGRRSGQARHHECLEILCFRARIGGLAGHAPSHEQAPPADPQSSVRQGQHHRAGAARAGSSAPLRTGADTVDGGELRRAGAAVIVPAYGQHHLTRAVLQDLRDDGYPCAVYIVDNGGDYRATGEEYVLRPGANLRWAGGCNLGLITAQQHGHAGYVLLNNDVRLSHGFLLRLLEAWRDTGAALVGPVYDHNWPQQRVSYAGPASEYRPRKLDRAVPFTDGTCMFIPHRTLLQVGLLDERTWPRYGWGCDKDYALRVREASGTVWVTERAYLNHLGRQTAAKAIWYSEQEAEAENDAGMAAKWGPAWKDLLYAGFDSTPREGVVQHRIAVAAATPPAAPG